MKKITNKEKLATFDAVKNEREKLRLALYDVVNHKFGVPVTRCLQDFSIDTHGRFKFSMSWRAMPLFLIECVIPGQDHLVQVLTEAEIQDGYRECATNPWWRAAMSARNELVDRQKQYALAAIRKAEGAQ